MEMHGCILNIVGTDALVLKHHDIRTHSACCVFIVLVQYKYVFIYNEKHYKIELLFLETNALVFKD